MFRPETAAHLGTVSSCGGIISVGGAKVHPEEVESVVNRHSAVWMSRARARRSPVVGSVVVVDVVLAEDGARRSPDIVESVCEEIMATCRRTLEPHKVPASIHFVERLEITTAGNLRTDA